MFTLKTRLLPQKIFQNASRAYAGKGERIRKPPYWHAIFPDGRIRSFDEMPTYEGTLNTYRLHEDFPKIFQKHGYVLRQPVGDGIYTVHLFHFDDFFRVNMSDAPFIPKRKSHAILRQYRENNKDLYDHIGLGPGDDESVMFLRALMRECVDAKINAGMEEIVDDLMDVIREKVGEGGEIDLLPLLLRWSFESIGYKFLGKRLGALSESGSEEANKMVEAAAITNEMIAVTTLDPTVDYDECYEKLATAQNYFYDTLQKYVEEAISNPDLDSAVKRIVEGRDRRGLGTKKDAVTVILDGFQGSLQTVSLTVLMTMYHAARNKNLQIEARQQLMDMLPTKEDRYCHLNVENYFTLADKFMLETLRMNPPIIGNGRIIQMDFEFGGYLVPRETNVLLHFQVAFLNEEFFRNPLKFDPHRHYDKRGNLVMSVFGNSRRMCAGMVFARNQMAMIISKLLRNFEFSYQGGEIRFINKLHNEPDKPLVLGVKPLQQ